MDRLRLTESDLHRIVEGAVMNILMEYGDKEATRAKMAAAAKRSVEKGDASTYRNAMNSLLKRGSSKREMGDFQKKFEENPVKECGPVEEDDEFNEQPTNDVVESKRFHKMNESQFFNFIRECVTRILSESGETHRFGLGKFGLAMDAASRARSLGRYQQADNLTRHGAEAFNKEFGTKDFSMDDSGKLKHYGEGGVERVWHPRSEIEKLKGNLRLDGGNTREYQDALNDNSFIRNAAQTAKAFPRKKMTGGIEAMKTLDDKS